MYSAKAITDTFYNSQKEEIRNTKSYINKYIDNLEENSIEKINKNEISQFFNRIFDLIEIIPRISNHFLLYLNFHF